MVPGTEQVALLSAVPIGSVGGTTEMNFSPLHRFLAKAVWYPTALLPSPALSWTLMDDVSALETLTHRAPFPCHLNSDSINAMRSNLFTPQVGGDHLMVGSNR